MKYSFSKIREYINVQTFEELRSIFNRLSPRFFEVKFSKSKQEYLKEFDRLLEQIDNDYHFVWVLKQEKYAFQLRWKESVLKAHLDLLVSGSSNEEVTPKAV